jgi:hypothetical protein
MKALRENRTNDMGDAMISRACAHFLSDTGLQPDEVRFGGAITAAGAHKITFTQTEEWSEAIIRIDDPALCWAELEHDPGRDRATLMVGYPGLNYCELSDGHSELMIDDAELPEAICRSHSQRGLHLSQLIELTGKESAFLQKSDPIVLTLRNNTELNHLELLMRDQWSLANWNF